MGDYCPTLTPIPQFQGTCWFNAILTCLLYSQELSKVIRNKAIEENWKNSNDIIKVVFNRILIYIEQIKNATPENRINLNQRLNKYLHDVKPELILLKFVYKHDRNLFNHLQENNDLGYYINYIYIILYYIY